MLNNSGVYIIKTTFDNRIYVGSSINMYQRWYQHKSLKRTKNYKLTSALKKYGIGKFYIEVLDLVNTTNLSKRDAKQKLLEREQFYLDTLQPFDDQGFNISKIAGSTLGNTFKGRRKTPLPYTHSIESKLARAGKNSWRNKSISQFDSTATLVKTYFNITEAAKEHNTTVQSIVKCCKNKQKTAGEYLWAYEGKLPTIPAPHKSKAIGMYDIKTNKMLQTFTNAKRAGEFFKTNANPIYKCLREEQPSAFGYTWKYL